MYDLYSDLYSKLGGNKNIEVAALNIHLGYEFVLLLTKFFPYLGERKATHLNILHINHDHYTRHCMPRL